MGSGPRLRLQAHRSLSGWYSFSLGVSIIPNGEHKLSVHLSLGFHTIYIGIGKGYDE